MGLAWAVALAGLAIAADPLPDTPSRAMRAAFSVGRLALAGGVATTVIAWAALRWRGVRAVGLALVIAGHVVVSCTARTGSVRHNARRGGTGLLWNFPGAIRTIPRLESAGH